MYSQHMHRGAYRQAVFRDQWNRRWICHRVWCMAVRRSPSGSTSSYTMTAPGDGWVWGVPCGDGMSPSPLWERTMPLPRKPSIFFWFLISKSRLLVHSGTLCAISWQFQLIVHTKKHCFWAYSIAVACTQTAKGGKTSLLETIRGL